MQARKIIAPPLPRRERDIKQHTLYVHNSVLTSPAIYCPKPGGNVRDAITKVITPGYTRRLKQAGKKKKHKFSGLNCRLIS